MLIVRSDEYGSLPGGRRGRDVVVGFSLPYRSAGTLTASCRVERVQVVIVTANENHSAGYYRRRLKDGAVNTPRPQRLAGRLAASGCGEDGESVVVGAYVDDAIRDDSG